jgi:peptidyl-tRNA hydrolase
VEEDGMMKSKAVCVMRTDLRNSDGFKVPKGKLIAQGGHAFVGLITKRLIYHPCDDRLMASLILGNETNPLKEWITGKFTKIVLGVDTLAELEDIYLAAEKAGLNAVRIIDNGETEFGVPTFTCIGIGPAWSEDIDKITGHLKGFS